MIEHKDNTVCYLTPDSGYQGVWPAIIFVCLANDYTLTSTTGPQKIFNVPSGGALAIGVGTYFFEALLSVSSMSATSGNFTFDLTASGGAAIGTVLYHAVGIDGATGTAATQTGSTSVTSNSPGSIVTADTQQSANVSIRGTFRITSAGTLTPRIALVTAAAAVVKAGSYFKCFCVGTETVTTCGSWT